MVAPRVGPVRFSILRTGEPATKAPQPPSTLPPPVNARGRQNLSATPRTGFTAARGRQPHLTTPRIPTTISITIKIRRARGLCTLCTTSLVLPEFFEGHLAAFSWQPQVAYCHPSLPSPPLLRHHRRAPAQKKHPPFLGELEGNQKGTGT